MNVIPVIDLLDGTVIHAKHGQRNAYQPITSKLTHSSKPIDIIAALLDIYPFNTIYIADLNSIQQQSSTQRNHFSLIQNLTQRYPNIKFWVDAGIRDSAMLREWHHLKIKLVLGTENFSDYAMYQSVVKAIDNDFCLSLDFMNHKYTGATDIRDTPKEWPNSVIAMTLASVGSNAGPNIAELNRIKSMHPNGNVIAAGGIRNIDDF